MSTDLLRYMDRMADPTGRNRFVLRQDDNGHLRTATLADLAEEAREHAAKKNPAVRKWLGGIATNSDARTRRALRLYLREGSALRVAEIMGVSPTTARYYLHKAVMRCRLAVMRGTYPTVLHGYIRRRPGLTKRQSIMAACIATCDADELHQLRVAGYSRRGHIERNINALARALNVQAGGGFGETPPAKGDDP
jgi:hypothetical protein